MPPVPLHNEITGEKVQIFQPTSTPLLCFLRFFVHIRKAFVVESATKDQPELQRGSLRFVVLTTAARLKFSGFVVKLHKSGKDDRKHS